MLINMQADITFLFAKTDIPMKFSQSLSPLENFIILCWLWSNRILFVNWYFILDNLNGGNLSLKPLIEAEIFILRFFILLRLLD